MKQWKWIDHLSYDNTSVHQSDCEPLPGAIIHLNRIRTFSNPNSKRYSVTLNYKDPNGWRYADSKLMACSSYLDNFKKDGQFCFTARSLTEAKRKAPAALRKALLHIMRKHEAEYKGMLHKLF